ncbi:MAG: pyridoxal 5'-phosphate synthase glutaminase subunit PdxT [Ardenticatenia bacterium]|nr:MAG: pyridoxal 5'-phosphate synthase glutaminase subunit PdxT [Ardenticatenia bacterium]
MATIGVLALQGGFREHEEMLARLGATPRKVRRAEELEGLDALIIPGGESTTIRRLASAHGLIEPIRAFAQHHPVWGTCAGLIALANDIGGEPPIFGGLNVRVQRNAFGRQVDSFETELAVPALDAVAEEEERGRPFPAVFIRAPVIEQVGEGVDVLATLDDGRIVAVQQGHLLGTAFHPELTDDTRFHRYFLQLVQSPTPA